MEKIRVTIHGRGDCSFIVKNPKKIKEWINKANKSNLMTYVHSAVSYRKIIKCEDCGEEVVSMKHHKKYSKKHASTIA